MVVFFVVFNGINYYDVSMRIFIKLENCRDKENKFVRNFECEMLRFLSLDTMLSRFSKFHKLIIFLLH